MAEIVATYQTSAFTSPTNGTSNDADEVRGNDNTLRASLNAHDADPGIHFQGSTLELRPVAGTAGRKWLTTDDFRLWFDDGSSWQEIAYMSAAALTSELANYALTSALANYALKASPVFSGNITFGGHLLPNVNDAYDIGEPAKRVRFVYVESGIVFGAGGSTTSYGPDQVQLVGDPVLKAQRTGWTTNPTGTLTRTTFVSDSVTLASLAARVAALIVDLRDHGMIGA